MFVITVYVSHYMSVEKYCGDFSLFIIYWSFTMEEWKERIKSACELDGVVSLGIWAFKRNLG